MALWERFLVHWRDASTKWYETELIAKEIAAAEADAFREAKIRGYFAVCAWGLGSVVVGKELNAMAILNEAHPIFAYGCTLFFLCSFLYMALGAAVVFFPKFPGENRVQRIDIAGLGALVSIVRAIGCYHLVTLDFHPHPQATWAFASFMITSAAVCVFWGLTAQDPGFLHAILRLVGRSFRWSFCKIRARWNEASGRMRDCRFYTSLRDYQTVPESP